MMLRSRLVRELVSHRENDVAIRVPLASGGHLLLDVERVGYDSQSDTITIGTEEYPDTVDESVREMIVEEFVGFLREEGAAQRAGDFADRLIAALRRFGCGLAATARSDDRLLHVAGPAAGDTRPLRDRLGLS